MFQILFMISRQRWSPLHTPRLGRLLIRPTEARLSFLPLPLLPVSTSCRVYMVALVTATTDFDRLGDWASAVLAGATEVKEALEDTCSEKTWGGQLGWTLASRQSAATSRQIRLEANSLEQDESFGRGRGGGVVKWKEFSLGCKNEPTLQYVVFDVSVLSGFQRRMNYCTSGTFTNVASWTWLALHHTQTGPRQHWFQFQRMDTERDRNTCNS